MKGTKGTENDDFLIKRMREQHLAGGGIGVKMPTIRFFLIADSEDEVFALVNLGLVGNDPLGFHKPEVNYVLERIGQKSGSSDWHVCFLKATSVERFEQDIRNGRVFFEALAKEVTEMFENGRVVYDGQEVEVLKPVAAPSSMIQ